MIKKRILLASVLKPINDTRMYGKLGLSLAKLPEVQIHIAGYQAPVPPAPGNMQFHPLFNFKRLSWRRFFAPLAFLKLLFKLSPDVIILGTHELLLICLFYKIFRPCRLIYDVRENYYLNLTSQKIYAPLTSRFLAFIIRLTEKLAAPFISPFFLAEKSYAAELPFIKSNCLILENKYQPPYPAIAQPPTKAGVKIPEQAVQLLYSGTISELYGVFKAVDFCNVLNQVLPIYYLTIIGYCPQPEILMQLKKLISGNDRVNLIGGDKLVPHHQILQAISDSHVGLLPYQPHPSTAGCIPTKLYEYMAQALPIVVTPNPLWQELVTQFNAGLAIDFDNFPAQEVHQHLHRNIFYDSRDLTPIYWLSEEKKLLNWATKTI
jgi:glycogen synthase